MQNNLASEDNIYQAMLKFKKLLSTFSTSLANSKSHHSKHTYVFDNKCKRNNKYNKESLRHKHWPRNKWKK